MKNNIDDNFKYHILVIISDGEIDDLQNTIDSIIESSKYPLSIIIIGVGDIVCDDMKKINGENGKLISSDGEILKKDIVQYVHFNDYADDMNKLAEFHKGKILAFKELGKIIEIVSISNEDSRVLFWDIGKKECVAIAWIHI